MSEVHILLVEDHLVVRNGMKLLLEAQPNFSVVADVNNGSEALEMLKDGLKPDIVLTDLNMKEFDGMLLIEQVSSEFPDIKVIVLSMMDCEQHVSKSFENGAKGYLVKNVAADELVFCINHVAKGGRYLCEELSMNYVQKSIDRNHYTPNLLDPQALELTSRELEILELLGEGLTNLEISKKLFLSKRTVEGHRQNLIDKTGSKNTPALIKFAVLNGLLR
ncbi:response regulator transcription factor [Sphingobacterium lactis]|uniref:DNA-binding response regulator, NarL/FixJ family, contains REC and HTH domains n=1 Tax=Sphingobacterium lactis TaxID=797291 RepID=A0A1H5XI66_9SPHI|nr:response regulator transcription factor [Sphingobacterium lactis]SEG11448.1 DNA-binding response regulator, NarL/FixJ family, contains REC and HTH domains [Sphingobacterium lactis]